MRNTTHGVFPFGQPVLEIKHVDDGTPKEVFVLGVYASAVHACWRGPDDKVIVRALAVASEPCIFWTGHGADDIIRRIAVPREVGSLSLAGSSLNGPSGTALDNHILAPLGFARHQTWLCDLRPWSCSNPGQVNAIRLYHDRTKGTSLPRATVEPADQAAGAWADDARRQEILSELKQSKAKILITLGDQPLKHFVHPLCGQSRRLAAYAYGKPVRLELDGLSLHLLPLAHPRQIGKLGTSSQKWYDEHQRWKPRAKDLMKAAG